MTGLRERVVEAGAWALCEEDGWVWEQVPLLHESYRRRAALTVDAGLDCLTENADEWGKQAWFHAGKREHLPSLLAVLREDR